VSANDNKVFIGRHHEELSGSDESASAVDRCVMDESPQVPHEAAKAGTPRVPALTPAQLQLLSLVRSGLPEDEIASGLEIPQGTLKTRSWPSF
jgi:DNA-binding NarL/FixJ family response regulator